MSTWSDVSHSREGQRAAGFPLALAVAVVACGHPPSPPSRSATRDDAYDAAWARIVARSTRVDQAEPPFPGMFSDAATSMAAVAPLASVVGRERLVHVTASLPFGGDDFALYQRRVPGAMFWLGVADPERGISGLTHAPDFQADERAIAIGARAMAAVIRARMTPH